MLKRLIFLLSGLSLHISGFAQANTFFDTLQYNFGHIHEGDSAVHDFTFINKSEIPLIISDVKTTCSCTASEYPKKPVAPGEKSFIRVVFDSKDKEGYYAKGVNLSTNQGEINIIIFAEVHKKEAPPSLAPTLKHD